MSDSYPYILSNNKIDQIFSRVRTAAKPERFSIRDTLQKWGFTASNDRAIVSVLKELGFLNEGGVPTPNYDRLRDPNDWKYVLAERMRDLYSELFAIDSNSRYGGWSPAAGQVLGRLRIPLRHKLGNERY
ncbi:MAG: DUF5343 domain-containing protein [Rhodospirillaceae bacterium]